MAASDAIVPPVRLRRARQPLAWLCAPVPLLAIVFLIARC